MRRPVCVVLILGAMFVLTACSTLEVGIETRGEPPHTSTATVVARPTATSTPTTAPTLRPQATASPTPKATLAPTREAHRLRVALIVDGDVWLWDQEAGLRMLSAAGDATDVRISDDGQIVAFLRGITLWAINSDGSDERTLIGVEDIASMVQGGEPGVRLYRFEWVPDTHTVAFNTQLQMEIGLLLNDDLHLVDADTLERSVLLPRGKGGEFHYAPDGRQIAIVRSGTITLVDADGKNERSVFTYTPPVTYSEFAYYARPAWAADAGSLRVVIPPADPLAEPPQLSTVWHLYTDGRPARLLDTITATAGAAHTFSSDVRYIAYLGVPPGAAPGPSVEVLLIADLVDGGTTVYAAQATGVYEWTPDAQRFAFLTSPQLPRAMIGQLGSEPIPALGDGIAVIDVRWLDNERYLCTAIDNQDKHILLGEVGGASTLIATVTARAVIYDFAR